MNKTKKTKARFKVGDWVSFRYGVRDVVVQIIEDRGPIGYQGRRLYRIEMPREDNEPDRFEAAEEGMTLAAPPDQAADIS